MIHTHPEELYQGMATEKLQYATHALGDLAGHPLEKNPQKPEAKKIILAPGCTVTSRKDESHPMKAVAWFGKKDMKVVDRPKPCITDPKDAVLKITSTCICGSDLHLYLGTMAGMQKEDIVGHEFMGIVEEVGPEVKGVKAGDRVVACFDIGCGQCKMCTKHKLFSACDTTNPSVGEEAMYGHKTGGFYGYSHLTGGWEGGQSEYVRVPFADTNLLHVPAGMGDDDVILLSDILPTAWHACEMGEVGQGDVVAIWGAGPVGQLAAHCAQERGAARVILIDNVQYRLQHALDKLKGVEVIDFSKDKPVEKLQQMVEGGPDVCIEAVGFHYAKSLMHQLEMKLSLETDPSDMLNEMIRSCRKGGRISIVGVYAGYTNHFNIGGFMEKGLTMRGGQTPVQRYWHMLLDKVRSKRLDPTIVITHRMPLEEAATAYKLFNDKLDNCIKVVLKPSHSDARAAEPASAAHAHT